MRHPTWAALALMLAVVSAACSGGADERSSPTTEASRNDRATETETTGGADGADAVRTSAGCDADPVVVAGEEKVETTSGEDERWYFRHVPPSYDGSKPLPLVLDFHGYSEGAEVHVQMSQLGAYGDEQGFITVTPHGLGPVPRWENELGSADITFVGDLLDELEQDLCLDLDRVYATGLSNGAFMTSAVACAYSDRVAAAAPVAGISDIDGCTPERPVPVIAFHGTDDGFVTYDGGLGDKAAALPAPDGSGRTLGELGVADEAAAGPSVPEITAAWATRNGCEPTPEEKEIAEDVTLLAHPCPEGAETQLYRVEGGGHTWPGSELSKAVESVTGPTTFSIDANELMWEFFENHPREDR